MRLCFPHLRSSWQNLPQMWLAVVLVSTAVAAVTQAQSPVARPPVPGASAGVTAFVGVNVVPMDAERVLPNQTVLVQNGRITVLGPAGKVHVPVDAVRIDGRGKVLIPGLADMHAHLFAIADSAGAERNLLRWLANGVTTIRNMDQDINFAIGSKKASMILPLRTRTAAGELLGPRIYTAGPSGITRETKMEEISQKIAAYKAAGYDILKVKGMQLWALDSIAAAARLHNLPFGGHVAGITIEQALAAGYASVEHFEGYVLHLLGGRPACGEGRCVGVEIDSAFLARQRAMLDFAKIPAIAAATKRAGVWNCPNLMIYERLAEENGRDYYGVAYGPAGGALEAQRRLIRALQDAGAGLLLGADAGIEEVGASVHEELEALVRAGLTPYEALATGTRNVAVFLKTLDETGTIAVGKRADLVLLQGNPLQNIRNTSTSVGVMVGGRWLLREELDRLLGQAGPRSSTP